MKELLEAMAPVCNICDVDFRNLVEDHDLGTIEDINANVNVLLAYPSYNVQGNRITDNSEYDVYISADTRNRANTLQDVITLGAQSYAFFSLLQSAL